MESENQVLRQQPLLNSSVKTMSEHLSTHVYEKLENGHHLVEDQKATETQTDTPVKSLKLSLSSALTLPHASASPSSSQPHQFQFQVHMQSLF
ncbi:unnamed protein product [Trifolium pratense]|uniref:Uncharacterized protein n=1 Tax=Trifolium pratense TaxID=57577 RepID=A0ACB0MCF2_TRIPR|nr:unnamed protein product [Trifolium pratense]